MLAQRQRELYSIQHRQRQLFQQKVMLMRQNMAGAPAGAVGSTGTARVPKGPPTTPQQQQQQQQQFNFPPGYNPMTGKPPTSPSHFTSMTGGPLDNKLSGRVPLNNQTLMGAVQGQFSSTVNSSLQQGLFQQFAGSGEFKETCSHLLKDQTNNQIMSNQCCYSGLWIITLNIIILIHPVSSCWKPSHCPMMYFIFSLCCKYKTNQVS